MERRTGARAVAAATLLCVALSGCASSGPDPKGTRTADAAVLGFAATGRFADQQIAAFEQALEQRSGGRVSLAVDPAFDPQTFKIEQSMIEGVAAGDLDLAWVGVRAFSELGVHDFDPLIAPMLLDSLDAQRAVLESELPQRMLAGVEKAGVVGLALMGGELRHPIAADAPLLSLADFAGIPFYSTHGDIPTATITALGARNIDASPDARNDGVVDGSIRAIEATVGFVAPNAAEWLTRNVTADLTLWPSIGVLIVNPRRLASLSDEQRSALVQAAADASASSLDLSVLNGADVDAICTAGGSFAASAGARLEEIRAALEPVYDTIRAEPGAAEVLDEIVALKGAAPPDTIDYPAACAWPR